ncbi:MAG: hypothetical protein ACLP9S_02750 [Syntrophales bacterium]
MSKGKKKRVKGNSELRRLMAEQARDMRSGDYINNCYDPRSKDIYHHGRRSSGSGFYKH